MVCISTDQLILAESELKAIFLSAGKCYPGIFPNLFIIIWYLRVDRNTNF